ncbi:regulator of (H+)-ATPase in vacuolar membrane [Podila humilis]|nr:regulator of (H+)-ATPase in vacuolar membrane [Podila humilis]
MLLQQVCPGKTGASLQSIHSVSYESRRYVLYAATDSVVICDASFKPVQILFLQGDSKEELNQVVSAVVMSEFDGKIAVTTNHHVLIYAPSSEPAAGEQIKSWMLSATLECEHLTSLAWRNDGRLLTGSNSLTLWGYESGSWSRLWEKRQGAGVDLIQFTPDGKLFASMSKNDRLVKVWYQQQESSTDFGFFYLSHPRAVSNFSWRKEKTNSASQQSHINVLFTMARDGICRIWSPLILLQPESMSICAIIDPNQWLVSQQQQSSHHQYPIHALDGMEFAMAVEYAASKNVDRNNDVNSIRIRKLKERVRDTSDLFFQIQGDGSMIIWGIQSVTPLESSFFMRNIIAYHDTTVARCRGSQADVVIVGQSHEGRVSCFSVNLMELFDSANTLAGLSLRQSWTGQQSRIKAIVKDHRQLCFTSLGDLGDISLWKLKTPRFGHRVAAGLVEVGSLPIGARNVQLVTPSWEGGSFMVYDGQKISLYTADSNAQCSRTLDLPDYDSNFPLTLLDSFEIPHLVTVEGNTGKTTDVAWRRFILGFSPKNNTVFTWQRDESNRGAPILFSKESLPPFETTHAVTVESFAGTLPKSLHSTHVNVFATYSQSQANISYWECGHDFHAHRGEPIWQRAERIPTRPNLKFFQCGANGKLALVYEHKNGTCDLEIWGSVGGRATGRLEKRFSHLDRIYDVDWMVTADARHNLAVAFRSKVSMYSPQRTEIVTSPPIWMRFLDVNIPSFINHPISAIAWLDMGTLSVGAGGTMLLYSKWLSEDYTTIAPGFEYVGAQPTLHHGLSSMHGPLVDYHPNLLIEFMMWGKFEVVRKILFNLYHYMSYVNESNDTSTGPLPIPLEVILKTDVQGANSNKAHHKDLFMSDDDFKGNDENKFLNDSTSQEMIEFLTRVPLVGLSKGAQLQLTAFIEGFAKIKQMEVIARNQYMNKEEKDPVACTLFYIALRKKKLLHGLWRTSHGHAEQGKMVTFLANDFELDRWKTAALKNAFALLGKQRFAYAAAFFLLGDKLQDAVNVCVKQLNDFQLAIALCRVYESEERGPVLTQLLKDIANTTTDPWLLSLLHSNLDQPSKAIQVTLVGDRNESLALKHEPESSRDPSLLILYRHLLNHSLVGSVFDGDEEFSAVVRAAESYEHYGCPLLSLVILKHWGYVVPVDQPPNDATSGTLNPNNEVHNGKPTSSTNGSAMSFMGGFKSVSTSSNMESGMLDFDNFNKTQKAVPVKESSGMSLMESFSSGTPNGDSGLLNFDNFGAKKTTTSINANSQSPKPTGMSLMGGFKTLEINNDMDSGTFDFDSFSKPKKMPETSRANSGTLQATAKSPGMSMSLLGGYKTVSSSDCFDNGMLDFDSFGSMGQKTTPTPSAKPVARDIFATFGAPTEYRFGATADDVDERAGSDSSDDLTMNDDKVRGTEELLNDYITTLVVQLLTPMASALRTVSLKPELLVTPVFKGYVENIKFGWDKLSEHANVSSVVMEQALISKCIEIDTLPVCFHWLNTTMSTGSPLSAIVSHYSESCYSMVGIVLTERLTGSVLESSSEWFNLAKNVVKQEQALPRWEQMVLASYIMLVAMALQEQDYVTLSGMLFQWRRFSGFVVGDRGGAVKVIAEVLGGNLYSPLDAQAVHYDTKVDVDEKSAKECLQDPLLSAATTNALVMSLEGLLREHGHRMSDETRKFVTSSFLDRLSRSGIEQEKKVLQKLKDTPPQDHLRGYLNSWQKKYWVILSGLESGGHLLPLVADFLESRRAGYNSPPAPVEDTSLLYKTRSVITSFSFNPVEKRIVAVCSRSDIIEVDISKALDFQKNMNPHDAEHSDMDSEMDLEEEEDDDHDFLDAEGNVIDRSANTSKTPSVAPTENSEEISRGSQVSLQTVFKNIFTAKAKLSSLDGNHVHHPHGMGASDPALRRSQSYGLAPSASLAGSKPTEVDNIVVRTDVVATCSENHPSFPLYLTGHNPTLGYPCVTLWQFGQSKDLNNYTGTNNKITKVHFDPFGQKFGATDVKGDLHLWRFDSNTLGSKPFLSLNCHDKIARDFAFLGSSSVLATTGSSGDGKSLAIWDVLLPKHKAQVQSYKVHDRGGYSLAFSKTRQLLVSGGRDGEICIFDVRQPKLLHTMQAHEMHVRSLYIDEAGRTLCSGAGEGDMKVWNLETFEQLFSFENLQARNRFQIQTFDRIPVGAMVKAYGVAQIVATDDYYFTCGPTGFGNQTTSSIRTMHSILWKSSKQFKSLAARTPAMASILHNAPFAKTFRSIPPPTTTPCSMLSSLSMSFNSVIKKSASDESVDTDPQLTHTDPKTGKASMVSVTDKPPTNRTALAVSSIWLPPVAFDLLKRNAHKKGDVLTVAQIAGIQAAKHTSNLIPLCHPLLLTHISVDLKLVEDVEGEEGKDNNTQCDAPKVRGGRVDIESRVACSGNTGVEMEALTGATFAALTVFDMCKAVGKDMVIGEIKVMEKTGGKSGVYKHLQSGADRKSRGI